MRRFIALVLLALSGLPFPAESAAWFTDAQAALDKAKREEKFVLLDFTGSDWCGWCVRLKREVFDQSEFVSFADEHLVLVEVDFPHHKNLSEGQKRANRELAGVYSITGYPTIILLNSAGQQVGRTGYRSGGPGSYVRNLEAMFKTAQAHQPSVTTQPAALRKEVPMPTFPPVVPIRYGALALKGISGTKERRMVLINNANLMTGETAKVKVDDRQVLVCCKEIREDSVLITADEQPMELKLGAPPRKQ